MVRFSADFEDTDLEDTGFEDADEGHSFHSATNTMGTPTINSDFVQALAALSPEAQAIVLTALSNQRPKHKLKDPDPFDGKDNSLFPQFEGKLRAKLNVDGAAIGNESEQIWYAFNLLKDDAAARIHPWMHAYEDTAEFTKAAFLEQISFAFKDHAIRDKAIAKLNTLRQGRRSFQELLTEFDRLLLEAGGYGWDDTVKKGYLRAAINNELRERLITMDEAESYVDYCGQVKRVGDRIEEHKRIVRSWPQNENRGQQSNRQPIMPRNANNSMPVVEHMDWEPTPAGQTRVNHTEVRRARWVSEEERDKRKKEGRCLRCGALGHLISKCPYRPAARPAQAANVVAYEPELEEPGKEELL
jgi:hypothetical protein